MARHADHPQAEALLLPDTALHTAAHIPALEKDLGKPVLTANQVTVWEGLRLADRRVNAPELGVLFTREPLVQA
jgi:maleate cis-trans isomerase